MHKRYFIILVGVILGLITLGIFVNRKFFTIGGMERVNILILGKSGAGHAGPDLTDTLILASVALNKPEISLISIPRDLWIPEIRAKINSAYYWGGTELADSLVEKIIGQSVDYTLVINFSGFKDVVDAVGGIEVGVERSFTDTKYPIAGKENDLCDGDKEFKCRYETLSLVQGGQKMDGELALKYFRSRNGDNGENTDLAREARQQKVITAIKNEVLSVGSLINFSRDIKIYKALKASVETNIDRKAGLVLAQRLFLARDNIASYVFPDDLLVSPPVSARYDNQYVFIPKAGDWSEFQNWVKSILF